MCKYTTGCPSNDTFNCKNCQSALCRACHKSIVSGHAPPSEKPTICGDCGHNFKWYFVNNLFELI